MAVAKKPAVAKPKAKAAPKTAPSKLKGDGLSINTSVDGSAREKVAEALTKAVADSYTLYVKTLGVHWNVQGANFYGLHKLTDGQYNELHQAADEIAERIRALGHYAPGTYREYSKLSSIAEPESVPEALEMVRLLVSANESVAKTARSAFEKADAANDQPTADLLTQRLDVHEKNAWMLRSLLQ